MKRNELFQERSSAMKKFSVVLILSLCVFFAGCRSEEAPQTENTAAPGGESSASAIRLDGSAISAESGVTVDGATATVTASGTYEITGTLENGQIIVDTAGTVDLILNNASIHCETSSPIQIKNANQIYVTLAEGSSNELSDGTAYELVPPETEPDATLFSKSDLTIRGEGTLTVTANYRDGITSKDSLVIESGNLFVTAVNHAIKGKDFLCVENGTITVDAGVDGMKATNDSASSLGYVEIKGGTIAITAQDEGISAITDVTISGGTIRIDTANNGIKTNGAIRVSSGTLEIQTEDKGLICAEQSIADEAEVSVNGEKITST